MFDVEVFDQTEHSQAVCQFAALPRVGDGIKMANRHGVKVHYTVMEVWFAEENTAGVFQAKIVVEAV